MEVQVQVLWIFKWQVQVQVQVLIILYLSTSTKYKYLYSPHPCGLNPTLSSLRPVASFHKSRQKVPNLQSHIHALRLYIYGNGITKFAYFTIHGLVSVFAIKLTVSITSWFHKL